MKWGESFEPVTPGYVIVIRLCITYKHEAL